MNPRQRRGVLLLIVAAVAGLALILTLAVYVADVQRQLGPMGQQLRLTEEVDYLDAIPPDAVEVVEVPEQWIAESALSSADQLTNRVAAADLAAGTVLQESSLTVQPDIVEGQREMAILVDPETGVGGKIQAGDLVDVYATYDASTSGEGEQRTTQAARSEVVLQGVRIVDVSPAITTDDQGGEDGAFSEGTAVPVTFALDRDESLRLAYAESFATELRLGRRVRTDDAPVPPTSVQYSEE